MGAIYITNYITKWGFMGKKLYSILTLIVVLFSSMLFAANAKASAPVFTPIGGTIIDGWINSTNTSFEISEIGLSSLETGQTASLYTLTPSAVNITLETYSEPGIVSFKMPSGAAVSSYFEEGANDIKLKIINSDNTVASNTVIAPVKVDFTAPQGTVGAVTSTGKNLLKIGDSVDLVFVPSIVTDDESSVTFVFNSQTIGGVIQPDGSYLAKYIVTQTDVEAYSNPLELTCEVLDLAGNETIFRDNTAIIIDSHSPSLNITSPEIGKTYNTRDVKFTYTLDDRTAVLTLILNGRVVNIENGGIFADLQDGRYNIEFEATDNAGNTTIAYSWFEVDATVPLVTISTNPDGGDVKLGEMIVFEGTGEAGSNVLIEIFSDSTLTGTTTIGSDGKWRIEIDSSSLSEGCHEAYLTISDKFSNSSRSKISSFKVVRSKSIKLAYLAEEQNQTAQDVSAPVVPPAPTWAEPEETSTEVAKVGNIVSSEDSRAVSTNWSAWIILLGVIVLASALATAGYYGYEWVTAGSENGDEAVIPKEDFSVKLDKIKAETEKEVEVTNVVSKKDEVEKPNDFEPPQTRW